ncbi:MAG: dehydrogenase [Burkholderiales bacterium PBB5]|nr:MAG: dehydrogenase [Burkholderiales bacterium PBB5]
MSNAYGGQALVPLSDPNGTIPVGGDVLLDASATGGSSNNAGLGSLGDAGVATATVTGPGTFDVTGRLRLFAAGFGGDNVGGTGGTGLGGRASIATLTGGTIIARNEFVAAADGFGGGGQIGGDGFGGIAGANAIVGLIDIANRAFAHSYGYGGDARFGTNPFCVGVPLSGQPPLILDFATSVIAQGKTRVAHNKGEAIPPGCVIDNQGRPSTDPRWTVVPPTGALLTFGGELGAHKGFGLALMCELLGGALAAGHTQRDDDGTRRRVLNGMFSILLDPVALGGGTGAGAGAGGFEAEALAFIDWVKASPPRTPGQPVQVAGEPERAHRARRSAEGVPVDATTWSEILAAATKLGVDAAAVQAAAGLAG